MLSTTIQPSCAQVPGARRGAARLALVCAASLASVALLTTGPAQARIETPLDTGGRAVTNADSGMSDVVAHGRVTPTRLTGLYGVKVGGGWLLR